MNKQFKFPLEKVLDYRKNIENKKAEALNKIKIKKKSEEEILELIKKEKHIMLEDSKKIKKSDLNQLTISSNYLNQLNDKIKESQNRIKDVVKEVDQKLFDLKEASVDKRVVEKLKEKKLVEHKNLIKKFENKKNDDVASRIHKQKNIQ